MRCTSTMVSVSVLSLCGLEFQSKGPVFGQIFKLAVCHVTDVNDHVTRLQHY